MLERVSKKDATFDDAESIGLVSRKTTSVACDEEDMDLAPLLSQLQNHLDSIRANTDQVAGIDEEMLEIRTALTSALQQSAT
jgi:hypothetical protein